MEAAGVVQHLRSLFEQGTYTDTVIRLGAGNGGGGVVFRCHRVSVASAVRRASRSEIDTRRKIGLPSRPCDRATPPAPATRPLLSCR
jgi:hypothetical protein